MAWGAAVRGLVVLVVLRGALIAVVALAQRSREQLTRPAAAAGLAKEAIGHPVRHAADTADDDVRPVDLHEVVEVLDRRDALEVQVGLDRVLEFFGILAAGSIKDAREDGTRDLRRKVVVVAIDRVLD